MNLAIALAKLAQGQVSPNPAVGAVVVKNGVILGQGYTQPPGSDHAEIVALKQAGDESKGATLYCTLEPCCHQGRTAACTQAIIDAGIKEVHYSIIDPNPLVNGKGNKILQQAGVKTLAGENSGEASEVNEAFLKYITTGLPFVTVKIASSLDGRISTRTGDSKWITGESARRYVQHLRYVSDAIMTGANTIIVDDPHLTVRLSIKGGTVHRQPLRIVVDGKGRVSPSSQIFKEPGKTMVVLDKSLPHEIKDSLRQKGAELLELPSKSGEVDLKALLKKLGDQQITSILVEAGGILVGSLFDYGLVDKVVAFMAPIVIGGEEARPSVAGKGIEKLSDSTKLQRVKVDKVGEDIMVTGYVKR